MNKAQEHTISPYFEGYLKQGNFINAYSKRYFMIIGDYLYAGKSKTNMEKKLNLKYSQVDRQADSRTKFVIMNTRKKYKLKAKDLKEKQMWIKAI